MSAHTTVNQKSTLKNCSCPVWEDDDGSLIYPVLETCSVHGGGDETYSNNDPDLDDMR